MRREMSAGGRERSKLMCRRNCSSSRLSSDKERLPISALFGSTQSPPSITFETIRRRCAKFPSNRESRGC